MSGILVVGTIIAMIITSIELWIVTRRVRKRMKKTMGRKPSDLEMASLKTWMEVEQTEELNKAIKSTHSE